MITLTIPGTPIAKMRPRFVRKGKFVDTYDPQETEEGKFLLLAKEQFKGPPLTGYLKLSCQFYYPVPKSTSNKKRLEMLSRKTRPQKKDLSNLIKFVEDCFNEVIWCDDRQIVSYGNMDEFYAEEPRTIIQIERLGETS